MTLRGGLSSAIIGLVFIQYSGTGLRKRSWMSTWKCRQPRELAVNSLSGKRGAAQRGSLLAAEWRFVVLGGRLVVLVVNER